MSTLANRLVRLEEAERREADTRPLPYHPVFITGFFCHEGQPPRVVEVWPRDLAPALEAEIEALIADRRARLDETPYSVLLRIVGASYTVVVGTGLENLTDEELLVFEAFSVADMEARGYKSVNFRGMTDAELREFIEHAPTPQRRRR